MTSTERATQLDALARRIFKVEDRPTVWFASKGPAVSELQDLLAKQNFYFPEHGDEPGVFSRFTEAALLAFQSTRGLPQTAVCDQTVWAALLAVGIPKESHDEA